jgi:hypothetical protein
MKSSKILSEPFVMTSSRVIKSAETVKMRGLCPFTGWLSVMALDSLLMSLLVIARALNV